MISTKYDFNNRNIRILSIDFETRHITTKKNVTRNQIFAAGFFSNTGFREAIHLEDEKFKNDESKIYSIYSLQGTKLSGYNYWLVSC